MSSCFSISKNFDQIFQAQVCSICNFSQEPNATSSKHFPIIILLTCIGCQMFRNSYRFSFMGTRYVLSCISTKAVFLIYTKIHTCGENIFRIFKTVPLTWYTFTHPDRSPDRTIRNLKVLPITRLKALTKFL